MTRMKSEWTLTADEMPTDGSMVLALCKEYYPLPLVLRYEGGLWYDPDFDLDGDLGLDGPIESPVTHWIDFPEP